MLFSIHDWVVDKMGHGRTMMCIIHLAQLEDEVPLGDGAGPLYYPLSITLNFSCVQSLY